MRLRLRFLSLSKTLSISLQSSICFSFSPPSSSKKWMEHFSTSREPLGRRRPSVSRGSVKIVERCQQLGIGVGGFYRPGYGDGAKLNLQMMCLGKNWDPESRQYGGIRPCDGSTPPKIPEEFRELVDKAIQASHEFLRQNSNKPVNVEDELPRMSPDICIVNFYSKNGRLGLHQDRDESKKSLDEGLPVVSFSLGDDADFLYGNNRDVDSAKTVVLKSGDVLLFGGKSRHLFHGVSTIHEKTAPSFLIDKSKLKPGRLNLTFRQY